MTGAWLGPTSRTNSLVPLMLFIPSLTSKSGFATLAEVLDAQEEFETKASVINAKKIEFIKITPSLDRESSISYFVTIV
jgi:hypothetical protein